MLASTTATMPPADAPPTSKFEQRLARRRGRPEVAGRGRPVPVTKISAKMVSRKIVSIRMTTVIGRARCGRVM